MITDNSISVRLGGPSSSSPVLLADFSSVCSALKVSLKNVERCVTGGHEGVQYVVADLSQGSACMTLAPGGDGKTSSSSTQAEVSRIFRSTIQSLENAGLVDDRLDYAAIKSFEGFFPVIRRPKVSLCLAGVALSPRFVDTVTSLVEPSISSFGSVKGRLEALDLHNHNNFVLYLPGKEHVTCVFEDKDLDSVIAALQRKVLARGILHYSRAKSFPVRVDVESFDVEPEDDELSSLLDARGVVSPEHRTDFLKRFRKLRNDWN